MSITQSLNHLRGRTKGILKDAISWYISRRRPFHFVTRLARDPLRWYFHRSHVLRHDSRGFLKPRLLLWLNDILVGDIPQQFMIHGGLVKFRSFGSVMSVHGYYVGEIEYHLVKYVINQLRPNFTMIDVGAHHGAYSLIVAYEMKRRGWCGKVLAFEPDPRNFDLLKFNIEQNDLADYILPSSSAVSDHEGEAFLLRYSHENSANTLEQHKNSFFPETESTVSSKIEVHTMNLDGLLDQLQRVDMIKLDIQGNEMLALMGAERLIQRDRPILVIEAVPEMPTTNRVLNYLLQHHYVVSGVTRDGKLCKLGDPELFVSWDWVALAEDEKDRG